MNMDLKTDAQFLSTPPGIEKRKERSKLLEDAGNFYNKLFVIYAKHVKTDNQTYDNIEHLQQKASEFLKLVKRTSIHDKTGIFSKPIISITSDSTDVVESIIPPDKTLSNPSLQPFSPVKEQFDNNVNDDLTSPIAKEPATADLAKTIDTTVSASSDLTIDYYVNLPQDLQDNPSSDENPSPSDIGSSLPSYKLQNLEHFDNTTNTSDTNQINDHSSIVTSDSINDAHLSNSSYPDSKDTDNSNYPDNSNYLDNSNYPENSNCLEKNVSKSNDNNSVYDFNLIGEAGDKACRDEHSRFETTSIHSSNSFQQHEKKEYFDKCFQTDLPTLGTNSGNLNPTLNYNIYWDSIETFTKRLNRISYKMMFLLLATSILCICCTLFLIIGYNSQYTTIIPLISICIYGIAFTVIPKFKFGNLGKVVSDWKNELNLSETISSQLPTPEWFDIYVKNIMKFNYSKRFKWLTLLLIGVSILGIFNMDFSTWPWGLNEWIYLATQLVVLLFFTISPMASTPIPANAAKYFAMKSIFSLFQLQSNGMCSLSLFGENSPFLIRRTDFIKSSEISQLNTSNINQTLAIVRDDGRLCLFEHDQYITIYPPITSDIRGNTTLYITTKYVRFNLANIYLYNNGLFDKLLYHLNIKRLFRTTLTAALEFDTKFALDTFTYKLNTTSAHNLNIKNGIDSV